MGRLWWNCAALSDVGRVRDANEDSVFCSAESGVFLVADGMGGHAAGEVASAIASQMIGTRLCELRSEEGLDDARERFLAAFRDAGSEIVRQARQDETRSGMGTTATVLVLRPDDHYIVGHIGDSRAYRLRDGVLSRITTDHSWVQEQVARGVITPEQAERHPQSNIITRALGTEPSSRPDLYVGPMRAGDRFLISSDGLTDMLDESRIRKILGAVDEPVAAAGRLISEANLAGGIDNVSAVVVHILAREEEPRA